MVGGPPAQSIDLIRRELAAEPGAGLDEVLRRLGEIEGIEVVQGGELFAGTPQERMEVRDLGGSAGR
jgi:cytidylate kinase